jgi:hypothetical protein
MAFGFRYWMVFLPEIDPNSFLLFVHNAAGATKLQNYSSGREQIVGQPDVAAVFRETEIGKTRYECEPHKTDDHVFWYQRTQEFNRRCLSGVSFGSQPPPIDHAGLGPRKSTRHIQGRARKGSQRQLQDYVNDHSEMLSKAILELLPNSVSEFKARIRWVSPLAQEGYREYRDTDFLRVVGLDRFATDLAQFWPSMGPSWDALGIVSDPGGRMKPGVILVEAKSHIPEIQGSGCQASSESLIKIEAAIGQARAWCGASTGENWLGPLYQSANRIAHLYWLYARVRNPVWPVNLYFTDDPIGPAGRLEWEREVASVKTRLGLMRPVPNAIDLYLPALVDGDVTSHDETSEQPKPQQVVLSSSAVAEGFEAWARRWMEPARFGGAHLPEPTERIKRVLEVWDETVPGVWTRGFDDQLLRTRYRRGDVENPHSGEHSIEYEILSQLEGVSCLGGEVVDGINAMPFARDEAGGRRGNVEGDLFLLVKMDDGYLLVICEVKHSANTCWYAAIESLRQLKLLHLSTAARQLFHLRNPHLALPAEIPIAGLVVAPGPYFTQAGQKSNVLPHTISLLDEFRRKTGISAHLATWDAISMAIRPLLDLKASTTPLVAEP